MTPLQMRSVVHLFSLLLVLGCWLHCTARPVGAIPAFEAFRARLSVDYGPRIVGVATCDPFGNIKPFCTFANKGDLSFLSRQILAKARTDGVVEILVGVPLDSNGRMSHDVRNFNGQLCLNFSRVLSSVASAELPRARVLLVDERYTTREAKARMKAERIRASLDAMSAACLLERYMEDEGQGAISPPACVYPPPKELAQFDYDTVKQYIRGQYYDTPQSILEKKRRTMQKLKDGILKGKHHIYFDDRPHECGGGGSELLNTAGLEDEDDEREDEEEDEEEDGDDAEGGVEDDAQGDEEEEEEEDLLALMLQQRDLRRKRGTLRRRE